MIRSGWIPACLVLLRVKKLTLVIRRDLAGSGTAGPERARPETCRSFGLQ
jgi:hypothetical protein